MGLKVCTQEASACTQKGKRVYTACAAVLERVVVPPGGVVRSHQELPPLSQRRPDPRLTDRQHDAVAEPGRQLGQLPRRAVRPEAAPALARLGAPVAVDDLRGHPKVGERRDDGSGEDGGVCHVARHVAWHVAGRAARARLVEEHHGAKAHPGEVLEVGVVHPAAQRHLASRSVVVLQPAMP